MNWKNSDFFWILAMLLIIVGVIPRFLWLDKFPAGMSHDELEYILSAKSYFQNGYDLSGFSLPLSIFQTKTVGMISFLPAIIMSPIYGIIDLSQQNVRLPYIVLNLLTAIVLYFLTKKVFENRKIGILSVIVFLYSPWSFYFSRMASDTPFALFFGLAGMWLFLKEKRRYLLLSFLLFTLSFLSYHGAKTVIPLIVVVSAYFKYKKQKMDLKSAITYVVIFILLSVGYLVTVNLLLKSTNISRQSEIVFFNKQLLEDEVNRNRALTVENKLTPVFENKLVSSINIFLRNYLASFSPEVLFTSGDERGTYRFGKYGLLHKLDILLLILGLVFIIKSKKPGWIIIMIGLIAPVTTGMSTVGVSVINRSFMLLPILTIIIACGIYKLGKWSVILLVPFWIYFLFFYFMRWPKVNQEAYFLSERIAANYIHKNIDNTNMFISNDPRSMYLEAYFYASSKEKLDVDKLTINGAVFTSTCPKIFDKYTTYITTNSGRCFDKYDKISIAEEEFGGPLINIYNDKLCSDIKLSPWVTRRVDDYAIESMMDSDFCQKWIVNQQN